MGQRTNIRALLVNSLPCMHTQHEFENFFLSKICKKKSREREVNEKCISSLFSVHFYRFLEKREIEIKWSVWMIKKGDKKKQFLHDAIYKLKRRKLWTKAKNWMFSTEKVSRKKQTLWILSKYWQKMSWSETKNHIVAWNE